MIIPDTHADLLHSTALAHIATLGADGTPQSSPVWFGWDGEFVLFSQYVGRQKLKNLQARPQVALSIVDPADPYRYLELRGEVAEIVDDVDNVFINSMAQKYLDVPVNPWGKPGQHRVIIKIRPMRSSSM
jgi:PPOX class probable F420-dependent enzyme